MIKINRKNLDIFKVHKWFSKGSESLYQKVAVEIIDDDDNEEKDNFKPCPFCGSKDVRFEKHLICGSYPARYWDYVQCYDCRIMTGYYNSTEEAVAPWNKREAI